MSPKVSVVIPVWNPGRFMDRCVDSLLAQTMPTSQFEVLFMDDGSTDGTQDRLDRLAAEHPHFVVHHLENSGWPGKPRNLGIERAAGDFVLFMDNDDALGPEALERMHAIGARNGSDIVIGKVISNFRGVPHQVFRYTRERCTVEDAPLFESLTPHKMFRRQFLLDNDIRYPEGKRRLEDQLIMARAYFPARNVSIVGDYVCYYYLKRDDGTNAGSTRIEPEGYYGNLREVLDVVVANTEPGALRDSIMRRFYRGEMLGRLGGKGMARYQPAYRETLVAEVRKLALEPRFDAAVHDGLPALLRVRSHLLRTGSIEDLMAYDERYRAIRGKARLTRTRWEDGVLVLSVRAWLAFDGKPIDLVRDSGRLYLPQEIALDAPADQRDCTDQLQHVLADATVKNRATADEFFLPAELVLEQHSRRRPGGTEIVHAEWVGEVRVDPATALGGRALYDGLWDISIRLGGLGLSRDIRVGRDRDAAAEAAIRPALLGRTAPIRAIAFWTKPYGNLSLDIGEDSRTLTSAARPVAAKITGGRGLAPSGLQLTVPVVVTAPIEPVATVRLVHRETADVLELPAAARSAEGGDAIVVAVRLPGARRSELATGTWDVELALPAIGWTAPTRVGRVLRVSRLGLVTARIAPESRIPRRSLSVRELVRLARRFSAGAAPAAKAKAPKAKPAKAKPAKPTVPASAAERREGISGTARLESLRWDGGVLVAAVRAGFVMGGEPIELAVRDGGLALGGEFEFAPDEEPAATGSSAAVSAVAKNRITGEDFALPSQFALADDPVDGTAAAEWHGELHFDPAVLVQRGGRRAVWDISVRLSALGLTRTVRLGNDRADAADEGARPALIGNEDPILAIPYWTDPFGNLSLDLGQFAKALKEVVRPVPVALDRRYRPGRTSVQLTLPLVLSGRSQLPATAQLIERRSLRTVELTLAAEPAATSVRLTGVLPGRRRNGLTSGQWDLALVVPDAGWDVPVRIGSVLHVPRLGPARVQTAPELRTGRHALSARELLQIARRVRKHGLGSGRSQG